MSRKQKNSSQDPSTKKARFNIWSKQKIRPKTQVSLRTSQETERDLDSCQKWRVVEMLLSNGDLVSDLPHPRVTLKRPNSPDIP